MNTDQTPKRQVLIVNARTGESRLSEPMPMHAPRAPGDVPATPIPPAATPEAAAPAATPADRPAPPDPLPEGAGPPPSEAPPVPQRAAREGHVDPLAPDRHEPAPAKADKAKADIETLEQFIAHVYARKGQRVPLKPKLARAIAQEPRLDEAATARLFALADADALLAVPRQLLMASREVEGLPALRSALASFVMTVMLRHPVFGAPVLQAAVRNLPEGPAMDEALSAAASHTPEAQEGEGRPKRAELQALRRNAVHLLATWWACHRGTSFDELAALLLRALWMPAARELADDDARLRALTEVEEPAALGWVGQRLRQQVTEARTAQERAEQAAEKLRVQAAELEALLEGARGELEARAAELEALRASSAAELAQLREDQGAERMHLQHDLEQLRGRLVRRLGDSIEMLGVGLAALRNRTPRTEVMLERAEHVVDALRAELGHLKEE